MKHGVSRQRLDPVLAPDQFGVARCLGPKDLDRWHLPIIPGPNWSSME